MRKRTRLRKARKLFLALNKHVGDDHDVEVVIAAARTLLTCACNQADFPDIEFSAAAAWFAELRDQAELQRTAPPDGVYH